MKPKQIAIATAAALSIGAAFANDTTGSSTTGYNSQAQSYTSASAGTMSTQDKDLVRQVQQTLQSKGYNPGPIDGQWGNKTQAALKSFQKSQGSAASGSLDSSTLVALGVSQGSGSPATSAAGSTGMNIDNTTNLNSNAGTSGTTPMPDTTTPAQPPGTGSSSGNSTGSTSSSTGQGTSSSR